MLEQGKAVQLRVRSDVQYEPMATEFVTVARLRAEMATILARLGRHGPLYLTQRGRPRAVLLDVDEYRTLVAQLEYLDDSVEALSAKARRQNSRESTRAIATVIRERREGAARAAKKTRGRRQRAAISR